MRTTPTAAEATCAGAERLGPPPTPHPPIILPPVCGTCAGTRTVQALVQVSTTPPTWATRPRRCPSC